MIINVSFIFRWGVGLVFAVIFDVNSNNTQNYLLDMTMRNDKHSIQTSLFNFYNRTTKPVPSFDYINMKKQTMQSSLKRLEQLSKNENICNKLLARQLYKR